MTGRLPEPVELERWEGVPVEQWRARLDVPRIIALAETSSTSDVARALAEQGAAHGTTVLAEHQSAGRGRRGRPWLARSGQSLLLTVVLRPLHAHTGTAASARPALRPLLPLRVGLAAARACETACGRPVRLKWPNDLLIDGAKVGGVLCEAALGGSAGPYVVAGIGINVTQREEDWPTDLDAPATSLWSAGTRRPGRDELLTLLLPAMVRIRPDQDWTDEEYREIMERDWLAGRTVRLEDGRTGRATGVRPDGGLGLEVDRRPIVIHAGTVRPIGEAP